MTRRIATVTGIVVCLIAAILLAGFLFSILHTGGFWLLPGFGLLGIVIFLQSFPVFPLTVILLLTIALSFLLRQFASYRRHSFLLLFLELLALVLLSGYFLSLTPTFRGWQPPPPPREGKFTEPFLRGYGAWRFHNVFQGTITAVGEQSYVMRSPDDRSMTVQLTPGIRLPSGPQIGTGATVLIIGEMRHGIVRAFGIRTLEQRK
ncbi:MAG: hypothetical protein WCS85_02215 [Candidatus Peribacteraceae bacterium]|jgi:uncharacterized membrane protein